MRRDTRCESSSPAVEMGTLEPARGLRAPRSSSPAYPRSWPGSSSSQKQVDRAGRRTLHTQETRAPWINETESTALAAGPLTDGSTKIVALPYYSPDWNNISKADYSRSSRSRSSARSRPRRSRTTWPRSLTPPTRSAGRSAAAERAVGRPRWWGRRTPTSSRGSHRGGPDHRTRTAGPSRAHRPQDRGPAEWITGSGPV